MLEDRIETLRSRHAHIEDEINKEVSRPLPDPATITDLKRQKLRMLLETYRSATKRQKQPCRIDVLGLILDEDMKVTRVEHIRNAVTDD